MDSVVSNYIIWDDWISAKKISASDVSIVIKRVDHWEDVDGGVSIAYPQYDSFKDDLPNDDFFIVKKDGVDTNIYKAIDNVDGILSTAGPSGTPTNTLVVTAENYRWKYMYSLSVAQVEKFVTENWIPVQTPTSDDGSQQWQVQQNSVDGTIESIRIDNPGTGYSVTDPIVVSRPGVDLPGTAFAGTVAAIGGSGEITRVNVTTPGTNYKTPATTDVSVTSSGTGAVLSPMVSPPGGHGSDAVRELGGFFVMVNVKLQDDEGGAFPTGDDFRIIGIIKNPVDNNGDAITATHINTTGLGSAAQIGTAPTDVAKNSGQIIYSEMRTPIIRSVAQTEDIKVIVAF